MADHRIIDIQLDDSMMTHWNADIEHERRVAIFDILEGNSFELLKSSRDDYAGPYVLFLSNMDGRLVFDVRTEAREPLMAFTLAMSPFRRVIRDYFEICDSYFEAIKAGSPQQIETIDMGRRGIHDQASERLMDRLAGKIAVDMATARRLFTLICALHLKDGRGPV